VVQFTGNKHLTQKLPDLYLGRLADINKDIIVMRRFMTAESNMLPWYPALPIRILATLGLKKFIIVPRMTSTDQTEATTGDIFLLKDFANLSASNPLIGRNVKQWGERFIDMSRPFNHQLKQLFIGSHRKILNRDPREVNAIWVGTGKPYCSLAEKAVADQFGAQSIVQHGIAETITLVHMKKEVVLLGLINEFLVSENVFALPDLHKFKESIKSLTQILIDFVKIIEFPESDKIN